MPTHNSVAKSVRNNKELNPAFFCPVRNCLWRTYNHRTDTFTICGKHGLLNEAAIKEWRKNA